jgi:hypothetical protein
MRSSDVTPATLEALKRVPRDQLVPPDAPERMVDQFVDSLDLMALGFVPRRRSNARDPHPVDVLLKVVLFAAVEKVTGYRPVAKACAKNVSFLFLCNCDPPRKSTIQRFWRDHCRGSRSPVIRAPRRVGLYRWRFF